MRKKSRNPAAPKRQNRLLTLSAALLLLPAAAWSTDISTVKFGTSPGTTTATVEADTLPTDPIGGTNGGILVKDATNQLTHSPDTALYGASNGNTVNVDGDVKTNESTYYTVVGGTTVNQAGDSSGNTVNVTAANASTIIGSTNNGSVVGGIAAYLKAAEGSDVPTYTPGKATGNTVTLTAGTSNTITVNKDLIGGSSTHSDATGNTVTIHGATAGVSISGNVYGGAADSLTEDPPNPATTGNANENTVTIDGKVTLSKPVRGGGTYHGNADGNTVSYDGTEGSVVADITGGSTNIGNANGNTVKIKGVGTITSATGGSTYTGDAKDNTVEIGGAVTITENVRGGTTGSGGGTAAGNVTGNHVTIGGTAIITENIDGGYSAKGNVSDNHVTFEASTLGK
ncbi:MAG: hypothetical protein LBR95_01175, partial [Azoarcus sp.]|nr:hypothetical protein [Azoarcus sp.]